MKKINKEVAIKIALVVGLCMLPELAFAVNKADSGLGSFKSWLDTIIPMLFGMGLAVTGLLYGLGWVGKQIFQQIGTGCIIGGAGSWIVSLFF